MSKRKPQEKLHSKINFQHMKKAIFVILWVCFLVLLRGHLTFYSLSSYADLRSDLIFAISVTCFLAYGIPYIQKFYPESWGLGKL
jgi:hypothetical protein